MLKWSFALWLKRYASAPPDTEKGHFVRWLRTLPDFPEYSREWDGDEWDISCWLVHRETGYGWLNDQSDEDLDAWEAARNKCRHILKPLGWLSHDYLCLVNGEVPKYG